LPADVTLDRLDRRRGLVDQFDRDRRDFERSAAARAFNRHRAMAYNLIGSEKVRTALDIEREPRPLRETYGMTVFGQAALAARRVARALGTRWVSLSGGCGVRGCGSGTCSCLPAPAPSRRGGGGGRRWWCWGARAAGGRSGRRRRGGAGNSRKSPSRTSPSWP